MKLLCFAARTLAAELLCALNAFCRIPRAFLTENNGALRAAESEDCGEPSGAEEMTCNSSRDPVLRELHAVAEYSKPADRS